jgi:hypothetical protein
LSVAFLIWTDAPARSGIPHSCRQRQRLRVSRQDFHPVLKALLRPTQWQVHFRASRDVARGVSRHPAFARGVDVASQLMVFLSEGGWSAMNAAGQAADALGEIFS